MLLRKNSQNVTNDLVFLEIAVCEMQALKFCVFLTGRLHFINDWRLQFLMDLFENVGR